MNKGKMIGMVCLAAGLGLLGIALAQYRPYQENIDEIEQLRENARTDSVPNFGTQNNVSKDHDSDTTDSPALIDFGYLQSVNEDIIGWISIPETHIDYPILQGTTLNEYLNKGYDGSYNSLGSIFTYPEADLDEDVHVVLFGHRTFDQQMFGDLNAFGIRSMPSNIRCICTRQRASTGTYRQPVTCARRQIRICFPG